MNDSEIKGEGAYRPVPPGVWPGRCYRIIDLGTQQCGYQGTSRLVHKLMVQWEVFGADDPASSLSISKDYTYSFAEGSTLRKDLGSWRGKDFTDDELRGVDIKNLLGAWAMLTVVTQSRKNEKAYSVVVRVGPISEDARESLPKGKKPLSIFSMDEPDMRLFESFSKRIQDRIKTSAEWTRAHQNKQT